jgi:2'-5' RNA ligase
VRQNILDTMAQAMIACYLSDQIAQELEIRGLEKGKDLHLTLAYLGDISSDAVIASLAAIEEWAEICPPLNGITGNISRFPASERSDGMDVAYLPFQSNQIDELRESLLQAIAPFGLQHVSDFEYTPHITIGYISPDAPLPEVEYELLQLSFDCVYVCVDKLHTEFPLMGAIEEEEEEEKSRFFVGKVSANLKHLAPTAANKVRSMYWGTPTPEDLARINLITMQEWEASDWEIVPFKMSDNLIWRSKGKWHPNVLAQMPLEMVCRPIIFDHNWYDSTPSVGLIVDAFLHVESVVPKYFARDKKANESILKKEKYQSVYALGAFHADMRPIINGLKSRRYNDVSTGSLIYEGKLICPHCSEDYGFDVDFRMVDEQGNWVCPHLPPEIGSSDTDLPVMEYIVYDGLYDGIELSLCLAGNLPLAGVVR